jgi:anti-sigma factor RsiW
MRCSQAQKWISRRFDGVLDDVRRAALAAHLADCEACRAYAEELAALDLDLLAAPEPTPDFTARVMRLVERTSPRRWPGLSRPTWFRSIAAGLGIAAALGGFAVGSVLQRSGGDVARASRDTVEAAASDAMDPLAADSVESVLLAMLSSAEE